jgi:hypothetical protein
MGRQAVNDGIEAICATPHIRHDHDVRIDHRQRLVPSPYVLGWVRGYGGYTGQKDEISDSGVGRVGRRGRLGLRGSSSCSSSASSSGSLGVRLAGSRRSRLSCSPLRTGVSRSRRDRYGTPHTALLERAHLRHAHRPRPLLPRRATFAPRGPTRNPRTSRRFPPRRRRRSGDSRRGGGRVFVVAALDGAHASPATRDRELGRL